MNDMITVSEQIAANVPIPVRVILLLSFYCKSFQAI